jgi:hypothetical protein
MHGLSRLTRFDDENRRKKSLIGAEIKKVIGGEVNISSTKPIAKSAFPSDHKSRTTCFIASEEWIIQNIKLMLRKK